MQPIVLQQVKLAGWRPAPHKMPSPILAQAPASTPVPPKSALIDSPIFNASVDLLGAFAAGALGVGAIMAKGRTSGDVTPLSSRPSMAASRDAQKPLFKGAGWAIAFAVLSLALVAKAGYEISQV